MLNLPKILLIGLLSAQINCVSVDPLLRPSLIEYKGERYWAIREEGVKEYCTKEVYTIRDGVVIPDPELTETLDFSKCLEKLKEGIVFVTTKERLTLDQFIETMGIQYQQRR